MTLGLIMLGCLILGAVTMVALSFLISSIGERERRATLLGGVQFLVLLGITIGYIVLAVLETRRGFLSEILAEHRHRLRGLHARLSLESRPDIPAPADRGICVTQRAVTTPFHQAGRLVLWQATAL